MSFKLRAAVTLIIYVLTAGCIPKVNTASGTKLIGGQDDTTATHYPSGIFLRTGGDSGAIRCGAVKVAPGTLLTAAHCIDYPVAGYQIDKGVFFSSLPVVENKNKLTTLTPAKKAQTHPVYSAWVKQQTKAAMTDTVPNIGVIYVEEAGSFAKIPVAKIDLNPIQNNETLAILGYGCEELPVNGAKVTYPFKRKFNSVPAMVYPQFSFLGQFVTDASTLCPGDLGSPVFRTDGSETKLVGINSYYNKQKSLFVRLSEIKDFLITAKALVEDGAGDSPAPAATSVDLVPNKNCRYRVVKSPTQAKVYAYKDKSATQRYETAVPSCKQVCVDDKDIDSATAPFSKELVYKRLLLDNSIAYISHVNLHLPEKCQQ